MNLLEEWFAWGGGGGGLGDRKKPCHFIIFSKNFPHAIALALNIMKLLRLFSAWGTCQVFYYPFGQKKLPGFCYGHKLGGAGHNNLCWTEYLGCFLIFG